MFVRAALLLCCFLVPSCYVIEMAYGATEEETATVSKGRESVPLVIWNRKITTFRSEYDGVSPKNRATFALERIGQIPLNLPEYNVVAVDVIEGEHRIAWIKVNGRIVFPLMDTDVDTVNGESYESVKNSAVRAVSALLVARSSQLRLPVLLNSVGIAVIATLVFIALVVVSIRVFRRMLAFLSKHHSQNIPLMTIGSFNLAPYLLSFSNGLARMVQGALLLTLAYLWLTFVLSLFPYTQPWSQDLSGFLLAILYDIWYGIISSVPGLFMVVVIFLITRLVVKAVSAFFISVEENEVHVPWFEPETAKATRRIVVVLIWVFALIVAYPLIPGSETKAFQGISVFLGLMVSLGSAGLVGQLIGGIVAVYTKSFQAGDYVRIGDHEGVVRELGILASKIVTIRKEEVTIPNALLMSSTIVNYSRQSKTDGAIVATSVTIGYDAPWRQVQELLLMGAARTKGIRKNPEPFVLQKALSDFYVEYTLMFRIDRPEERFYILSELHGHIQDTFNEYGVQIMSPNFVMQPDSEVVVPRERWYAKPAKGDGVKS